MKNLLKIVLIIWLIITSLVTVGWTYVTYKSIEVQELKSQLESHPLLGQKTINFAKLFENNVKNESEPTLNFISRIKESTNLENDYLILYSKLLNQPTKIETGKVSKQFLAQLQSSLSKLPLPVQHFCNTNISAVFVIKNFAYNGLTVELKTSTNNISNYILFLDERVFEITDLNHNWLSKKQLSLPIKTELSKKTGTFNIAEYVLCHEIGHAYGSAMALTPPLSKNNNSTKIDYLSFYKNHQIKSVDLYMTEIKLTDYVIDYSYFKQFHNKSNVKNNVDYLFSRLSVSNFPTLYSTKDPLEFFAESFAGYLHCIVLNRPFYYEVNNQKIKHGILQNKGKHQREYFTTLFKEPLIAVTK